MIFRAAIALTLLCPVIGVFLLELGTWGPDINEWGYPNGATLALSVYTALILATIWSAERRKLFHSFGAHASSPAPHAPLSTIKVVGILAPMAAILLFGAGGLQTILGQQGAGAFRISLTSLTGIPAYLILKCYAPATFAYVIMERAHRGPLWRSPPVIVAGLLLITIAMCFGYKTSIIMAMLPAITLLYWRAPVIKVAKLGLIASAMVVVAYIFMNTTYVPVFDAIWQRLFLWHGGVPWKVWGMYASGSPFPSYANTLQAVFSDRLFTALTGITRADHTDWVMAHFNALTTFIAGYTPEYIMNHGHNNAANAFSEGLIAGGITGAIVVAVTAGLLVNALYHLIDNRLKAGDFAIAALAACYLFYALMPWMLGGGIAEIVHSSVIFGMLTAYCLLRLASKPQQVTRAGAKITPAASSARPAHAP